MIEYKTFIGSGISQLIDCVSVMRVEHFREYPYLYDGKDSSKYEKQYLHALSRNEHAMIAAVYNDNTPIGIATALPLVSGADVLAGVEAKFVERGYRSSKFYYLSEIIVVPHCRGHGIATRLYRQLEAQAIRWGYEQGCLATVVRDDADPRAPSGYEHPSPLWPKFGYTRTDIQFGYGWKTFAHNGMSSEAVNNMEVWIKSDLRNE